MFHVFVEGAKDASPAGLQKLADAIAARYGLKATDLLARLKAGRFRVKVNTDRTTADNYQRELDKLGARCTIEAATAQNSRPTPLPFAAAKPPEAARPATPPSGLPARPSSPPGALPVRPSSPPGALPARGAATTTPPAGQFSSGLAAAFSAAAPQEDVGAFAGLDAGALSLASVDGKEDAPDHAFAPPPDLETSPAAPVKPSAAKAAAGKPAAAGAAAKPAKPAKPKDEPLDLFVPPEPGADDFKVELAQDDADELAAKQAPPAPTAPDPAPRVSSPELRRSQPSLPPVTSAGAARRGHPLGDTRVRFVAGVLLALGLGFAPAHFIAQAREKSAYAEIDRKVEAAQREADTPEAYATLDARRAEWLSQKYSDRRNIAIMAVLIWGAVGAGIAFLWFKKLPWDRLSA